MKNSIHLCLIILLHFSFSMVKAQPCLPFGITFTTQTAIDSFTVNHPGCTEIQGVLVIASAANDPIINLQGLSGITKVMGGVYIQQNTQLSNFNGLSGLHTIQGGLHIIENTGLLDLSGLDSLEELNGGVEIKENEGLLSLNGLQGLQLINGSVFLYRNFQLTSVLGLDSVEVIQGDLNIHNNLGLLNIDHLSKLVSITGDFKFHINNSVNTVQGLSSLTDIGGDFYMRANLQLENLDGMESLEAIGGDFYFHSTRLIEINALIGLTSIGGNLIFWSTVNLASIAGLINVETIGGELIFRSNGTINSLFGLDNIDPESITFLEITYSPFVFYCEMPSICTYLINGGEALIHNNGMGCASIEQVNLACEAVEDETLCLLQGITIARQGQLDSFAINYPGCVHILGDVTIQSGTQDPINYVGGLNHIVTIGGNLRINENKQIAHLNGFDSLTWIGGHLHIAGNMDMYTIAGFDNLIEIKDYLTIETSLLTTGLDGLSQLEEIGTHLRIIGGLYLQDCGKFNLIKELIGGFRLSHCGIMDFTDFSMLESVGGTSRFSYLSQLENFSGLENLISIKHIDIRINDSLKDIGGLKNISNDEISSLTLRLNPNLSTCNYSNICAYLESGKPANISNNAAGCNTKEDVLSLCVTSSGEVFSMDGERPEILVFPNPASAYLNIYTPADIQFKARVYNITGQLLRAFEFAETEVISLHDLPSGLYVLVFEYEGGLVSRKVVIE